MTMNFEQKAEYSSFDEICGKCLSMNSEDNVKRLLDQPDTDADLYVEIDVRPISDLIKGVDAGCPCCIFIAGVVDCSDLSEAESTVVSISCELLRERGGDHHQVPLQVRFWANLKTEFGGSELKCAYWNANALEGDEAAAFMTERAGYKYTPKDLLIRRIKERLDKCDGKHKCHPSTQPRLPTRVIEVGMEGEMPALRITHPSETGLYVALSYCWGGPQEMATTLSSLQSMAKGFDMDSLPKTIQDAVRLTRCLGFRYLWIDAFCIIQDSEDDKMHEINKMGTIYKNTVLTIAAASAQGVHDGFLHEVSALHHCVVPFKLTNGCTGIVHFSSSSSDPLHDPLNSRAWTLQEVMMSARNLYFGRSGMQWACLSEYRNLITGEILSKPPYPSLPLNTIPVLAKIPGTGPLEYWWGTLVKHYTQRALSFSEDRLPALSGIAGHFLRAFSFNDTYLAGIWQAFWFVHLEWYDSWHDSNLQAKTPSTARSEGPSWSWASFGGPVTFDFRAFSSPDAELLSALMFLVSSDAPLGRVHGGNLVIRARLAKLTRAEFLWLSSHPHPKKSEFRMDYGRDEPDGQERLRYMLLAYDFERSGMGLILQPQGNGIYVRVGQVFLRALYLDSVWPVTMERQTITII